MSLAIFKPDIKASYSASLFVALKLHRTASVMLSSNGYFSTTPTHVPLMSEAPSISSCQPSSRIMSIMLHFFLPLVVNCG